jgi:biotin carboxyl carrier protein
MKMQNELHSPRDGVVKQINFTEGEQVDAFQTIVELEPQ